MSLGGILPLKGAAIDDCVSIAYDEFEFTFEPDKLGQSTNEETFNDVLTKKLGIGSGIFNDNTNRYPIFGYDDTVPEFTALIKQVNSIYKINAILTMAYYILYRDIDYVKIRQVCHDERNSLDENDKLTLIDTTPITVVSDKLLVAFKPLSEDAGVTPDNNLDHYKKVIFDAMQIYLNLNINTSLYEAWMVYGFDNALTPTEFRIQFDITTKERSDTAVKIIDLLQSGVGVKYNTLLKNCIAQFIADMP